MSRSAMGVMGGPVYEAAAGCPAKVSHYTEGSLMSQGVGAGCGSGSGVGSMASSSGDVTAECSGFWDGKAVFNPAGCRIHMVGIGGCGMRGAARVLMRAGAVISGSDRNRSGALALLSEQGVDVHIGNGAENVPAQCDLVVHSAAVKDTDPELMAARRRGVKVVKYSQLLGLLMSRKMGIAVAGTHGKSTTTAMIAYVLREAGLDPSFVIGAGVEQLGGGSGVGDGREFVVEACEYDRSFHNLRPRCAIVLNVDEDHLDYYSGLEEIISSFHDFVSLVPADGLLVVNGEDRSAMRAVAGAAATVETFGFQGLFDWQAEILESQAGSYRFRLLRKGQPLVEITPGIPGRHNVANSLAAAAVCFSCGVKPEVIARALGGFRGAHRRMTERGCLAGVTVLDDYAHHPREIQATLKAVREFYNPRKLYVVFQPHQHSRTRFLLNDFAASFGAADMVIVPDIYFVRDSESERSLIDAKDLVDLIHLRDGDARYEPGFDEIVRQLCAELRPGDLVITMGAGNVWQVADGLLNGLAQAQEGGCEFVAMGDIADH
jgi:UDP-N-acetylmuramate--alanine ligase